MNIRKIHASSDGTIVIDYDNPNPNNRGNVDVMSIKTKDAPRPEFHTALQALKPHLLEILELPEGYGKSMKMTGLSIAIKGDVTNVILKAKKTLQNTASCCNLITPKKPLGANEESAGDDVMSDEAVDAINLMIAEAKLFINGERNQAELNLVADDDSEEEESEEETE